MHFDDRLATVLRQPVPVGGGVGARPARTQYRQLLDLLGRRKPVRGREMAAEAWRRMNALSAAIPFAERAAIIREEAWHLTSPELVTNLAHAEAPVAAAALQRAQLSAEDWEVLIPRLPVIARGFLRFRSDLPVATTNLLDRLGIHDRGLPNPGVFADVGQQASAIIVEQPSVDEEVNGERDRSDEQGRSSGAGPSNGPSAEKASEIGKLVERIEAFQRARSARDTAATDATDPRLPLGDKAEEAARSRIAAFDFTSDAAGVIDWANEAAGPMVMGAKLADADGMALQALRQLRPVNGLSAHLSGAAAIAGEWLIDAAPQFSRPGGAFTGYAGRFRRPVTAVEAANDSNTDDEASRIRQILHELRTPVNAIQGFAELIQQQLFGPVPHEYRAYAANIAGDSARMLAGFDELERLARLESGALEIESGESDFAGIIRSLVGQLQGVLATRMAGFAEIIPDAPCLVALDRQEAEGIAWRLLATLANTADAEEEIKLVLACDPDAMRIRIQLTTTLMGQESIYDSTAKPASGVLSAGVFGAGFALRLVRAEARTAGGDLQQDGDWLLLSLPHLTASRSAPSDALRSAPQLD